MIAIVTQLQLRNTTSLAKAPPEPAAFGISTKMARALAYSWRVSILSELSVRPMSPSRFVEQIGGDLSQVARCFRQLAKWGYIELAEERPGGRGGAAIEHIYRGIQRAHFDTDTWTSVPRSERDAVSRSTIRAFSARIAEAVIAGTFDEEIDRHLSWDGVALDREAWNELGRRLDEILLWLSELGVQSAARLTPSGRERVPTIVGLTAYRSAHPPQTLLQGPRRDYHRADVPAPPITPFAIRPEMAKALSNKWRCRILMELSARPLSPSQFVEEVGGSMTHVARCFRELAQWGFVEVFEERKGGRHGGGVERIYRETSRPYFDTPTWSTLPRLIREDMSQSFLSSYFQRIHEAIEAGTFDTELDRHLSWKPVVLDRIAWSEVAERLDEVLAWLPELESESLDRVRGDFDLLIPTITGLISFRAARHVA
jgi:DNA-binding transcriptional ArsR family regulator